jgi:hypothetical protein
MTDFLNPSDLRGAFRAWVEGPNEEAAYVAAA